MNVFLALLSIYALCFFVFFFQAEDGIRDLTVTGVQTCALPILSMTEMTPGERDILLVVDVQNDFIPGGALAVTGGHEIVPTINRLARAFRHVDRKSVV